MLILAAFAAASLLAAGLFAVLKGDTFTFAILLIVLALVALVAAPQVPLLMAQLQQAIDAAAPLALR
jgi:uncharacterized membrane protein